jgi:hypothetical protein
MEKDIESLAQLWLDRWLMNMHRLGKTVSKEGIENYLRAARANATIVVLNQKKKELKPSA